MIPFDDECMRQALEQALFGASNNEVPVGAVIAHRFDKEIVARASNQVEVEHNPTAHAELVAITTACKMINSKNLTDYDLYVTLEPCTMCAAAIAHARIGRIFYGASDTKMGAIEHGVRFFTNKACHHHPEIYMGILADESEVLLRNFFKELR